MMFFFAVLGGFVLGFVCGTWAEQQLPTTPCACDEMNEYCLNSGCCMERGPDDEEV